MLISEVFQVFHGHVLGCWLDVEMLLACLERDDAAKSAAHCSYEMSDYLRPCSVLEKPVINRIHPFGGLRTDSQKHDVRLSFIP